jgi:hypothetical protein
MKSLNFIQWYVSEKKSENPCTKGFLFHLALYFRRRLLWHTSAPNPWSLRRFITTNIIVNRIARPERNLYLGK